MPARTRITLQIISCTYFSKQCYFQTANFTYIKYHNTFTYSRKLANTMQKESCWQVNVAQEIDYKMSLKLLR